MLRGIISIEGRARWRVRPETIIHLERLHRSAGQGLLLVKLRIGLADSTFPWEDHYY